MVTTHKPIMNKIIIISEHHSFTSNHQMWPFISLCVIKAIYCLNTWPIHDCIVMMLLYQLTTTHDFTGCDYIYCSMCLLSTQVYWVPTTEHSEFTRSISLVRQLDQDYDVIMYHPLLFTTLKWLTLLVHYQKMIWACVQHTILILYLHDISSI